MHEDSDLLGKIVRPRKCLVAVWANVWPLLSMSADMSRRPDKSALTANESDEAISAKKDETRPGKIAARKRRTVSSALSV
jgi:hypothetical protein